MGNDTILYSYTVDPNGAPVTTSISTNIVTNPVLDAMITMVKSVDQTLVTLGDAITYTTILTNSGNTNATNITFTDLIPDGTTFITDSVTIDGITQIGLNPNTGITIGAIAPNSSISIAFQVTATSTPPKILLPIPRLLLTHLSLTQMHLLFQEMLLQTQCSLQLIQLPFFHQSKSIKHLAVSETHSLILYFNKQWKFLRTKCYIHRYHAERNYFYCKHIFY